jgi:hypothetical protein
LPEDDVVDKPRGSEPRGDGKHSALAHVSGDFREGVGVPELDVVDTGARGFERRASHAFELARAPLTEGKSPRGVVESADEAERPRSLLRREICVARAQGQTVGLAHRGMVDDRDGQQQVLHHPAHDEQLLVILSPENGGARAYEREKLGNHSRHTFEMPLAKAAAKRLGQRAHSHASLLARRVNLAYGGDEDTKFAFAIERTGALGPREAPQVALDAARVPREVLARRKLRRVDEDGDYHHRGEALCHGDEREVTRVQRSHSRYERHAVTAQTHLVASASQLGRGRNHNWRHAIIVTPQRLARLLHVGADELPCSRPASSFASRAQSRP